MLSTAIEGLKGVYADIIALGFTGNKPYGFSSELGIREFIPYYMEGIL